MTVVGKKKKKKMKPKKSCMMDLVLSPVKVPIEHADTDTASHQCLAT